MYENPEGGGWLVPFPPAADAPEFSRSIGYEKKFGQTFSQGNIY